MSNAPDKPQVQLTGEDGNAVAVIMRCCKAAKKAGWKYEDIEAFAKEAKRGDYDHVLRTAMEHFEVS